jgi:hypothetical protein
MNIGTDRNMSGNENDHIDNAPMRPVYADRIGCT